MDYFLIFLLWGIGVSMDVMMKVSKQRNLFPQFGFKAIWNNFFQQEWDSLMRSVLVLMLMEVALFIVGFAEIPLPTWLDSWGMYVIALLAGYAGQRLFYKYLGTAESVLEKKADQLKDKMS